MTRRCGLQPLPAPSNVCCTARLISVEGRKVWSSVELTDRPGGIVFAAGKVNHLVLLVTAIGLLPQLCLHVPARFVIG